MGSVNNFKQFVCVQNGQRVCSLATVAIYFPDLGAYFTAENMKHRVLALCVTQHFEKSGCSCILGLFGEGEQRGEAGKCQTKACDNTV